MAYKKKATKRLKKRNYRRRGKNVMSMAQLSKAVRSLPKPEVKTYRYLYSNTGAFGLPDFNATAWGLDNGVYLLNPTQNRIAIGQGTGQGQRIGNAIRTKSSWLTGIMYVQQQNVTYNPTPKPYEVMCLIYKIIGQGNVADVTLTNLFQNGNTSAAPTGSIQDLTLPINKDRYRLFYKRVFKIGAADNTGTGASAGLQYYSNNDYKRNVKFSINLTKYMDKRMKFQDTALNVQNDNLYLCFLPIAADGTVQTFGNVICPVNCVMTQTYNYTDV